MWRIVIYPAIGIGCGWAAGVLIVAIGVALWHFDQDFALEHYRPLCDSVNWPVWHLIELDNKRGGTVLYENPVNTFALLFAYWGFLGAVASLGVLTVRVAVNLVRPPPGKFNGA